MELLPQFGLGLWNGWILLVLFYAVFGILLLAFKREVVARLYDRSNWGQIESRIIASGKLIIFAWFALVILTPLNTGQWVFPLGIALFTLGLLGFVVALLNFNASPLGEPITKGLYRISRNPQQVSIFVAYVGISLAIGSWLALLLITVGIILSHVRIIAEEQSCLAKYGDSYREYMARIPRYFMFF